ncbi:hypothetical protein LLE87_32550, partial [Paenibacillus polymyxa]|nr:hypothetical protein [Paenibacillus polymyxa]
DFFNQDGDKVAEADSWCFRTERDHAREQGSKYAEVRAREPRRYSPEEIKVAYKLYAQEEVRVIDLLHGAAGKAGLVLDQVLQVRFGGDGVV